MAKQGTEKLSGKSTTFQNKTKNYLLRIVFLKFVALYGASGKHLFSELLSLSTCRNHGKVAQNSCPNGERNGVAWQQQPQKLVYCSFFPYFERDSISFSVLSGSSHSSSFLPKVFHRFRPQKIERKRGRTQKKEKQNKKKLYLRRICHPQFPFQNDN